MAPRVRRVTAGVDTHKDFHVAAALDEVGRLLGTESFPATPAGYRALHLWLADFGEIDAVGVEGTGAWGAGLARHLDRSGLRVVEVTRQNRQRRRRNGKSDTADAIGAARAVLSEEATATPKNAAGAVESIRILQVARRSAIKARTQAANQLHSVLVTAPDELRTRFAGLTTRDLADQAARLRPGPITDPTAATKTTLVILARRWASLGAEIAALDEHLEELTTTAAPTLLELNGVGTQNAAVLLTTIGDNPERLRSERSFAALCGTNPVDATSGRRQDRHRLNRGGDRQANSALYVIAICRLRWDPATKAYMTRRLAEGKTRKEVIRCLKRYIAREVYFAITADLAPPAVRSTATLTAA
jgi:transposase